MQDTNKAVLDFDIKCCNPRIMKSSSDWKNASVHWKKKTVLKEHSTILKIGSFSNSARVKQLCFTIFESIQLISGSGGSTFSVA